MPGSSALRTLLVDDEQPARKRLRKLLQSLGAEGRVTVVGEAADGVEALEKLSEQPVDLIFLDIQMPELNGFDVLERLPPEARPVVVFTTAYDEYALRAFEANAVDYLLKPVGRDRLLEAVARAERVHRRPESRRVDDERLTKLLDWLDAQAELAAPPTAGAASREYLRQISVPFRDRILIIPTERLASAEISEGITRLYVVEEDHAAPRPRLRHFIVNYTLDQLEANLDPSDFMRVHRSAIVQLSHIREMIPWFSGRYKLVLSGDHEVVASRERSKQLKEQLML